MFSKELYEEVKAKTKEINKMKLVEEKIDALINYRESIHSRVNDEVDELLANINLKTKNKEE